MVILGYEIAVILILACWILLTVANQFKRGSLIRPIKRRDPFALIPIWTFFAPRPGVTDHTLLYRDRRPANLVSGWRELSPQETSLVRLAWSPRKRARKAISDLSQSLVRLSTHRLGSRICLDYSYLTLLTVVIHAPGYELAIQRQFIIVRSYGYTPVRPTQILFSSEFHSLDD
jgi:hypothetical protein